MKTIKVRSWSGFVKKIKQVRDKYGTYRTELDNGKVYENNVRILFRGQEDCSWALSTTLERKSNDSFDVLKYFTYVLQGVSEIESFTNKKWNIPNYPELEQMVNSEQSVFNVCLPAYDYLIYLRHHGFPSPLLDWTESPFIAAYFAYINASEKSPAIYCYIEQPQMGKCSSGGQPMISERGSFVRTHKRHFSQKACYTISSQWSHEEKKHYFCPHDRVFDRGNPTQDVLIKIILPAKLRKEALFHLNDYNINHFTLFQSEDSLIKTIETKEFDIKKA